MIRIHLVIKRISVGLALAVLSGCATVNMEQSIAKTNQDAAAFTQGKLTLAQTAQQREMLGQIATGLLKQPLSQNDAVQLALTNSPALQAMLAQNWGDAANAAQSGRIANPMFTFERMSTGDELEFGRLLSFGLLDILTLPKRYNMAQRRVEQAQLRLTAEVVDHVTQVRQAWVKAIAAQQNLSYARQVLDSAEASAELARRMMAAGNFSKLSRARQQAFYADAATQLAVAQQTTTTAREALIRLLGLTDAQAPQLKLPDRLPDLPKTPRDSIAVSKAANAERLDIQIARLSFESAAKAQGLNAVTSYTDIELGVRRNTMFDNAMGSKTTSRSYEIVLPIPLFDWGGLKRDAMNASTLAAANNWETTVRAASSHLRESYSAYRTSYDIARHYQDEVLPLRKTIAEENVLRYNGMLIGIFELLADSRDQVSSVMAAITAEQQFWLADAALQAALIGNPTVTTITAPTANSAGGSDAMH